MESIKKILAIILIIVLISGCESKNISPQKVTTGIYKDSKVAVVDRVEDLVSKMTVDEKIGQMIQAESSKTSLSDVKEYALGSVLSGGDSIPQVNTETAWKDMIGEYQKAAASTRLGIPLIYGVDAVHGNSKVYGGVIFPHNIGLGAANDSELMKNIGAETAEELISIGVNWTFSPCLAVVGDTRWGRSYESFGENTEVVSNLAAHYIQGVQEKYKIATTAKHFIADGGTTFGTGDSGYLIDQGDAKFNEEELRKIFLHHYQNAVKSGVKTVMISFSSINGLKNHENKHLIEEVLKKELDFKGFVVSDWNGIHQLKNKPAYDQVVTAVNSGIDMLMEPDSYKGDISILKKAVTKGDVSLERINDAVSRILTVKFEDGLFEKPLGDESLIKDSLGSAAHRKLANQAASESLVLLKNNNVLPLKKDEKIFICGVAANNMGIQCGGWSLSWQGAIDENGKKSNEGTTILEGFKNIADSSGGKIITDFAKAKEAKVAVVVIGELPYAEGKGDDKNLGIFEGTALSDNKEALEEAKATGLPVVVIMVSGRPRIVTNEQNNWDAFVEAWLPGTEGDGVAQVLYGESGFKGKLPISWPKDGNKLPVDTSNDALFPYGFGLSYK